MTAESNPRPAALAKGRTRDIAAAESRTGNNVASRAPCSKAAGSSAALPHLLHCLIQPGDNQRLK